MKISVALFLASIGSASAFVAPAAEPRCVSLGMSDPQWGGVDLEDRTANAPPKPSGPIKSKCIPIMTVNACMDGSMAGDIGFDPLGFADSKENLTRYREAEIKHARLAMLAAAGWPLSELWDKPLANLLGMPALVDEANRVPSVLNGGLGRVSPFYWGFCILLAGAIDVIGLNNAETKKDYFPGNYGFDPLGLYPKDRKGRKWMQTAEIKNGRLAMVAITGFAFQEFATHVAVVDESPAFFHPIWDTLFNSVPGYSVPEEMAQDAAFSAFDAVSSAAGEAAPVVPDTFSSAASEAAPAVVVPDPVSSIAPPVVDAIPAAPVAPPVVDAIPAAPVSPPVVDAIPAAPVSPPVADVVPDAPVQAAAAVTPPAAATPTTVSAEDLAAAKARIAELEAKLATITNLAQ